jgi:osmotically-inducible protein OsmY
MIRTLVRLILIAIVVVGIGAFLLGYRIATPRITQERPVVGTSGTVEHAEAAVDEARQAIDSGALTAKIKAKMALDDTVKAMNINVDTNGSVVTLRGTVESHAQRERALQLARETDGVSSVVDQLQIR